MPFALPPKTTKQSLLKEAESQANSIDDLKDAQLSVAQKYGFLTWRQAEQYLELFERVPPNFEHLACLTYYYSDNPSRQQAAEDLLKKTPDLEFTSIHTAAAAGNVRIVEEFLDDDPLLLDHRGGYFDWEPLLYACYSRVKIPDRSTSDVIDLLIDRGANVNAYYRWGGVYLFSALTGICGEGERGPINQPEHPDYALLAERMLRQGADCNDGQALYNRMFQRDNSCLNLLLKYGLTSNHYCNWYSTRNNRLIENDAKTLDYQLQWAVKHDHIERTKLLLEHGADPTQKLTEGGRLCKHARRNGFNEIADSLESYGAKPYRLKKVERFVNFCLSNDQFNAKAMLEDDRDLVRKAQRKMPEALINAAAENKEDAIELMLDLGFSVHGTGNETPIHQAAHNGHLSLVEKLLNAGASLTRRDPMYCSTPLGWAQAGSKLEVIDYLSKLDIDLFDLINIGDLERIKSVLKENPKLLETPLRENLDNNLKQHEIAWQTPLAYAAIRGHEEVVWFLLKQGANADLKSPKGTKLASLCNEDMQEVLRG